jgi:hypothetical protein
MTLSYSAARTKKQERRQCAAPFIIYGAANGKYPHRVVGLALSWLAARLIDAATTPVREPRDVCVYFDNDAKVRAPFDAQALREKPSGSIA